MGTQGVQWEQLMVGKTARNGTAGNLPYEVRRSQSWHHMGGVLARNLPGESP
jgi:hypothetical protein